ncbi:ArsR/SmtB family transcription factor [Wenxinia marina]|uniref:Transcriptional regulator, ArsR family n=1 Tax=Wenxinia marina DSM 24838 TaxID=1123501 RepID=A0A0D0QBP8_9RHOB|nr:metalloregulator ArsR/SmtB family transcription factor [Wenxinia marina]KIQ68383.1 transcriptional regulator, ArsR family [Wenxinia marina DSM 24838]GGL72649.1 transcriptional regulator [Wenxinia marina]
MPDAALHLDATFRALSDPRRRAMLDQLAAEGPRTVSEIAAPAGLALPSAVKHLAQLQEAGLVASDKTGRVRTFRLSATAFADLESWVAIRRRRVERQLDRLSQMLTEDGSE